MAAESRVSGDKAKPLVPLFSKAADCIYTSCYCEENVWKLCQDVATNHASELSHCYVVFISNSNRSVPLWRQREGKGDDKVIVWDYHAILIYAPDERAVVYDLESALPFPTFFWKYANETFRSDEALRPEYHTRFRLVPATIFLQNFASNRHHMKREDGTWIKTPPNYPPISTSNCLGYFSLCKSYILVK
ncbi:protein N-terminal glutamine amidohydrolase isoform X1 [Microplitis demolitor]|uniref:protein N-terminal glutamine amidohydrolase isoform X1 n=1 Tax=Microplitis demolitor TaxID=69319 RepID=UPI0006D4E6A2|nr:protein N-terminal glutamine amidohydrolase isoform X1 [Microplitis demolitor]